MVGARLRLARERAGVDQVDLAVTLEFRGHAAISNVECGRSSIHVDRLARAARELGVSTDWLLGLTDDSTPAAELSRRLAERGVSQVPIIGEVAAGRPGRIAGRAANAAPVSHEERSRRRADRGK